MAKAADPARAELDARNRWNSLDAPPPPVDDGTGRKVALQPSARLREIERRARIITASTSLAEAVCALLASAGVEAEVDQVRAEPGSDEQVMAVRSGHRVVPVRPATTPLRVWDVAPGDTTIDLAGDAAVVDVALDSDGWASARAVADALAPVIGSPAT
ncbi:hypothetical protein [Saccharothrix obliqua]|uniref:hypothetical protein n=1 Tax=Saccharothrix obliqua TaxID=2861747 RepID=UPI001C5CCCDF|nr:hypothetical protein [Saccharothrix obliqua]MBW4720286.1 hypothetical protein [Saccharothrix obliqua]